MNFGPPYWFEGTPLPPENIDISHYQVRALVHSRAKSYIYSCYDSRSMKLTEMEFMILTEENKQKLKNQLAILQILDYPTIIRISDYFRYDAYLCFVYDVPTPNTPLFEYMGAHQDGIRENECVKLMYQMLEAVNHLHNLNICHRNIKLESFIIDTKNQEDPNEFRMILTNFRLADFFNDEQRFSEYVGSVGYTAPEIIDRTPYDKSVDIWSLGVTFFCMLSGRMPFPVQSAPPQEILDMIRNGNLDYDLLSFMHISDDAIDLIKSMCQVEPTNRITAYDALSNRLFNRLDMIDENDPLHNLNLNDHNDLDW